MDHCVTKGEAMEIEAIAPQVNGHAAASGAMIGAAAAVHEGAASKGDNALEPDFADFVRDKLEKAHGYENYKVSFYCIFVYFWMEIVSAEPSRLRQDCH